MRTMYDGINSLAAGIHQRFPNAAMVAGYIDGRFVWTTAEWNLFPRAVHVQIAVFSSTNAGDVIDCETGDATPAEAAAWVRMRKSAGYYRPTIYCSRSVIPAVRQATGSLILGHDYDIWCADYTGAAHQVNAPGSPSATCAATQYQSTADYDVSAVYDDGWPHRSPPSNWVFGPVRDLRLVNYGPHSVRISWASPADPKPAGVGFYDVPILHNGTVVQRHQVPKGAPNQNQQFNNLTPSTSYQIWIRACANGSASHAGPWAKASFTTTKG